MDATLQGGGVYLAGASVTQTNSVVARNVRPMPRIRRKSPDREPRTRHDLHKWLMARAWRVRFREAVA